MSKRMERHLREWETNDRDTSDDLHRHFDSFGRWDWIEVYREGLRISNMMFSEDVEDWSPRAGVFAAIAAQASHGAMESVAAMLGVKPEELRIAVAEWYESQDDLPPPVSPEGLADKLKEARAFIDEVEK